MCMKKFNVEKIFLKNLQHFELSQFPINIHNWIMDNSAYFVK